MIPAILHRVVPERTSAEVEAFWTRAAELHGGEWKLLTWRDPLDPAEFPLTAPWWDLCSSGAQLAGLARLEVLVHHGGAYIDSDVELFRPLDDLRAHRAFAAWEDERVVPDAVLGAEAGHPAIVECLALAISRLRSGSDDWRTGSGAWATGPGVMTAVLPGRDDVVLLEPESFYPYHYSERHRRDEDHRGPNTYGAHHWAASWLEAAAR